MQIASWKGLIPTEKVAAVEKSLQQAFPGAMVEEIQRLAGGMSPALIYKVIVQGKPYVLRLILKVDPYNDTAREFTCMRIAAEGGVAPRLYYDNAQEGVAIMDFVEATNVWDRYEAEPALMAQLAMQMKALHALPLFPEAMPYLDWIDALAGDFHASHALPQSATAEHFRAYEQLKATYPRKQLDLVSCHNELNPTNIVYDGRKFWFIDWEAACRNDRYIDIAILLLALVLIPGAEETFLRAYFGAALDDEVRAHIFIAQQRCIFAYGLDMMRFAVAEKPAGVVLDASMESPTYAEWLRQLISGETTLADYQGKLLFVKVALNESLRNMKSQRFEDAMRLLTSPHHPA